MLRSIQLLVGVLASTAVIGCSAFDSGTNNSDTLSLDAEIESSALRPLTEADALADFDAMVNTIKALYGPYEYKESRFKYNLEAEAQRIRAEIPSATDENSRTAKLYEFLRLLEDGHVSLTSDLRETRFIPIFVTAIESRAIVEQVSPALNRYGIERGDEILSVDGVSPQDILKTTLKYSWFGNPLSDELLMFRTFYRVNHMPEIFPKLGFAQVVHQKPDGEVRLAQIPWSRANMKSRAGIDPQIQTPTSTVFPASEGSGLDPDQAARSQVMAQLTMHDRQGLKNRSTLATEILSARLAAETADENEEKRGALGIASMGSPIPPFWSPRLQSQLQATRVFPDVNIAKAAYMIWLSDLARQSEMTLPAGLKPPEKFPEVFAVLYRLGGKTILMVRQPSYSTADFIANLAVYTALVQQFQPLADVMIVDQTHNPGGSATYVEAFGRIFMPQGGRGFVQFLNTDRRWYSALLEWAEELTAGNPLSSASLRPQYLRTVASSLESDAAQGLRLGKTPLSFGLNPMLRPAPGITWNKPFLILIDEICASGGDAFPMLMRDNGLGVSLGVRTAGLGGSVEPVLELPFLRSSLALTRGLFTSYQPSGQYDFSKFVENNGVEPDVQLPHSVQDFRQGFVRYFSLVSTAAAMMAGATPTQTPEELKALKVVAQ